MLHLKDTDWQNGFKNCKPNICCLQGTYITHKESYKPKKATPVIPALWEAEVGKSPEVRSLRPAWPTWWNPVFTKIQKISQAWWLAPVVPATLEAEAGESLKPRRWRWRWTEIEPLYFQPGWQRDSVSKKKSSPCCLLFPFYVYVYSMYSSHL